MNMILIQLIGGIAYFLLSVSYYQKKKLEILLLQICASLAFALHYYLLSGLTGAMCNIISMIMMIIIYLYEKTGRNKKGILIILMIPVFILIAYFAWENIYSIFPIFSSIVMLIAFLLKDENNIRIMGVISNFSWTIYGIMHGSYITIIYEVITLVATCSSFDSKKHKDIRE